MKRLSILCLVAAGVLYSAAAFASVCFLADTKCQEGKYQISGADSCRDKNPAWIHESKKCSGLVYGGVVCNDATGNYYKEGSCPAGYTDISTVDQDKYECKGGLLCNRCCQEVSCKSPYHKCENNSVPKSYNTKDVCQELSGTKDIKYSDCECRSPYVLKCEGNGITTAGNYCIDSDGNQYWTACQCASGYRETTLANVKCPSECTNGCSDIGKYYTLPGSTNKVCWEGATCRPDKQEVCPISYQSNFDKFWQGYDVAGDCQNLTVDCDKLGYNTGTAATGDKCKDGTEPYRCPFDHEAVYCESGIEYIAPACQYDTKIKCETSYSNSICAQDTSGCYNPSGCKSGYGKAASACGTQGANGWTLGTKDANGCGKCTAKSCTTGTTKRCSTGYTETDTGYYSGDNKCYRCTITTCSTGYAKDVSACGTQGANGWTLGTKDANGCGKCTAKPCTTGTTEHCGAGYNENQTGYSGNDVCYSCTAKPCPTGSATDKICDAGYKKTETGDISGNDKCYECVSVCSSGYTYGLDVTQCGTNNGQGWTITKDEAGCGKCTAKTCPTGSQTTHCGSGYNETIVGYAGNTACYKCEAKTCSKGYAKDVKSCGTTGAEGWKLNTSVTDDAGCYKCTEKTCADYQLGSGRPNVGWLSAEVTVTLGDREGSCFDTVSCQSQGPMYFEFSPDIDNCEEWCTEAFPENGKYGSVVEVLLDDGKMQGTCYTRLQDASGRCCCYNGEQDITCSATW